MYQNDMNFGLLKDIVFKAPRSKALLGMDVGKKTIGLALSNPDQTLATPLTTIKRQKFSIDMQELAKIVKEYEVAGFIIGLPLNMDGTEGVRTQSIRDFAREMLNHPNVVGSSPWIALWDERLSTASVEDLVDKHVEKRKTRVDAKASGLIDKLAAQVILDGALEFLRKNLT